MNSTEKMIQNKAYELGYEKCGIIPVQAMEGYGEKVEERIQKAPASEQFYRKKHGWLADLKEEYPWAKSIIVVVSRYGKYRIPESVKNHIGKHYLTDTRIDVNTKEYQSKLDMDQYLQELGIRIDSDSKFGLVGLRWAAMQAGLGIVRRNNFFYTESGSWVYLGAWLTDREMNLRETTNLPPCPKNCNRCIAACPTHSLSEPYTMLPNSCVSFLTTFGGRDLVQDPLSRNFKSFIYGCDICQDVCPMNRGKWQEYEEFPGLSELAPSLTLENILNMDESFYKEKIQPKFFYLTPEDSWKWKVNVLCFMRNNYQEKYKPAILTACKNENSKVRKMAQSVCDEMGLS